MEMTNQNRIFQTRWFFVLALGMGIAFEVGASPLDELAAMQTVVRAELDGTSICPEAFQGVSAMAKNALPMLIEAEIQRKYSAMSPENQLAFFSQDRMKSCSRKCRCGIYANWLAPSSDSKFSEKGSALLEIERRAPLGEKKVIGCARANQVWVCKSAIFRGFIADAKKNTEGSEP